MIKLNRKGYLTIEIILASVVAFAIAFFLIELTVKLVNTTNDYHVNTLLMTDKALITKNLKEVIEEDIKKYGLADVMDNFAAGKYFIGFGGEVARHFYITDENEVTYTDSSYNIIYSKKLNENLENVSFDIGWSDGSKKYIYIKIMADNMFTDDKFEVNIVINNNSD